ncbi:MAG: methionine--tRNA ligase [Bacteroidetes bacterium]|nr:MAG: methionine--tRNA ligase [Bacteroidota bacterium]
MSKKLITAALPYANGPIHIGHVAGCYLPADIYTRFERMRGEDLVFVCGSDEHGVAITMKARKEGVTPQEVVDKYNAQISDAFERFGIRFDHFSRTSRPIHHKTAQEFFRKLYDKGLFIEKETDQYYDEEAGQFLADRYIVGTCPVCSNENAYGDQCEKCGSTLSPTDLINPKSALSGSAPVLKKAVNWFLPMDQIAESPAFKEYAKRVEGWKSNVKGQFKSWLNEGLQPRAMTRDLDWGIPVPVEGAEGKVLYVWFDAPIGYISATKEYFEQQGNPDGWKAYWEGDAELIHFIGKDNIVFHSIIFPMMLMEHGDFVLPTNVPANEFLNLEGNKLSTSRNWAVWLHEYLDEFPGKNDELRYTLTSIAPETKDSDFTWKDYQLKVNSELVAILGNFVNRVMVLMQKYYEGQVPGGVSERHTELLAEQAKQTAQITKLLESYRFRDAQSEWMNMARLGNKFLADLEPWKLWKTEPEKVAGILTDALNICARLAILGEPFLPETTQKLKQQLGLSDKFTWADAGKAELMGAGHQLGAPFLLFTNIDDEIIEKQIAKLGQMTEAQNTPTEETNPIAPQKAEIVYDDFAKMDIRAGIILEAVKVPKADKLLQLTVDTGLDKRTIVSGIAEHFNPEDIIGQRVSVLVNLAPRKLRGIESQGMILMTETDGKLFFVDPGEGTTAGSGIS